jgi:hypothetical protein
MSWFENRGTTVVELCSGAYLHALACTADLSGMFENL